MRMEGGVYVLAWRVGGKSVSHLDPAVVYIGETSGFAGRMARWAWSAGFWGDRQNGHSAAWRWTKGAKNLSVAFFSIPSVESRRLAKHVRLYYEILATEEFRVIHDRLPLANEWEPVENV